MAFEIGSFTKITSVGTQDVRHSLGVTPSAIIIFTADKVVPNTFTDGLALSIGICDGINARQVALFDGHNLNPSDSQRRHSSNIISVVKAGAVQYSASFVSWDSTKFTLNWTVNDTRAVYVHYLLISDVNAQVVQWLFPTVTGNFSVGTSFQPDCYLTISSLQTVAPPSIDNDAKLVIGCADKNGNQWSVFVQSLDAKSPTDTKRLQADDRSLFTFGSEAQHVSMNSTGFTQNVIEPAQTSFYCFTLALKNVTVKAGMFERVLSQTVPNPQKVSSLGGIEAEALITTSFGLPSDFDRANSDIVNGGFEQGDVGWVKGTGWDIVDVAGNARTGNWFARRTSTGTASIRNSVLIPCSVGEQFFVSGWVFRTPAADGKGGVVLSWRDANGKVLSETKFTSSISASTWTLQSGTGTVPAGAAYVRPQFIVENQTAGTWRVDDMMFYSLKKIGLVFSFGAGKLSQNALTNPGFERGNVDWTLGSDSQIVEDDANARSGSWVLKWTASTDGMIARWQSLAVVPGKLVRAKAWHKSIGSGSIIVRIAWLDANGAVLSNSDQTATITTTYSSTTVEAFAPSGAVSARFALHRTGWDAGDITWVDDTDFRYVDQASVAITSRSNVATSVTKGRSGTEGSIAIRNDFANPVHAIGTLSDSEQGEFIFEWSVLDSLDNTSILYLALSSTTKVKSFSDNFRGGESLGKGVKRPNEFLHTTDPITLVRVFDE